MAAMTAAEFDQKINAIADTFIAAFKEAKAEMLRDMDLVSNEVEGVIPEVMVDASMTAAMKRIGAAMMEDVE